MAPGTVATRQRTPAYRIYPVTVATSRRLSPSFVRLTLAGDCLRDFGAAGADQRVKVLLPRPGSPMPEIPDDTDWYAAWQAMPEDLRPTMRTYTVRAYRPRSGELDVDFVLHSGEHDRGGDASAWAARAEPGDALAVLGPDSPGSGRMWGRAWFPPPAAQNLMLAGDETAVPAAGAILESLPPDATGFACLEIPAAGDRQQWKAPAGFEVRWLVRQGVHGEHERGSLLEPAVGRALDQLRPSCSHSPAGDHTIAGNAGELLWDVPECHPSEYALGAGDFYGWLAGEAAMVKRLRRLVVEERGLSRAAVAFMGYWKAG